MAPKIFITGVTGYIGGDVLSALHEKYPEYEYSVLVRTEEKGKQVKEAFSQVRVVTGDLDSAKVLEEEAAKADVVIHTADASDHEGAARAIAKGLSSGHSKEKPGFWLHTGGTGILTWEDSHYDRLGTWSDKSYNDWAGVEEITTLPDEAFHRNVDKLVLEAGSKDRDSVKTAILCPPTIYGKGRGPLNTRSRQAYTLANLILTSKYIPIIGEGKARWNNLHIADLSTLFVLLTEAAISGNLSDEIWGAKGYFLVENGEHVWSELARLIGKKAQELGYVDEELKEAQLGKDEAIKHAGFEAVSWGLNSRAEAERAKRVLGWEPVKGRIEAHVEEILRDEKERL